MLRLDVAGESAAKAGGRRNGQAARLCPGNGCQRPAGGFRFFTHHLRDIPWLISCIAPEMASSPSVDLGQCNRKIAWTNKITTVLSVKIYEFIVDPISDGHTKVPCPERRI